MYVYWSLFCCSENIGSDNEWMFSLVYLLVLISAKLACFLEYTFIYLRGFIFF